MSLVIDGTTYNLPLKMVRRKAELLFKYANRTVDGVLHSEPIGTFYNYSVEVGRSLNDEADYADLWVVLTEPVSSHEITLPDESGTLTFDCYFANIKDEVAKQATVNTFMGLSFDVIGISPARTP